MITVTQTRYRDGEHTNQPSLSFNDSLEAVRHLAENELAYGGQIVNVIEGGIEVRTRVLDCLDTSIFEGSSDEMRPLFELAYHYLEASQGRGELIAEECVRRLPGGLPILFTMIAPMLIGRNRLRVALMLACGLQSESDVRAGLTCPHRGSCGGCSAHKGRELLLSGGARALASVRSMNWADLLPNPLRSDFDERVSYCVQTSAASSSKCQGINRLIKSE